MQWFKSIKLPLFSLSSGFCLGSQTENYEIHYKIRLTWKLELRGLNIYKISDSAHGSMSKTFVFFFNFNYKDNKIIIL